MIIDFVICNTKLQQPIISSHGREKDQGLIVKSILSSFIKKSNSVNFLIHTHIHRRKRCTARGNRVRLPRGDSETK